LETFDNYPTLVIPFITVMKSLYLLICLFPVFFPSLMSQEKVTLWYNPDWNITTKEKAVCYREAEYDAGNFKLSGKVADYTADGKPVMLGNYSMGKKDGEFVFYAGNGTVIGRGQYLKNNRAGKWEYFYETGRLKQVVIFPYDGSTAGFSVVEFYDPNGSQLIKNGTGKWFMDSLKSGLFDPGALKRLTGEFKDSLMHGNWTLTRISDNKMMHTERFRKGQFVEASIYNEQFDYYGTIGSEMLNKFPDVWQQKFAATESFKLDTTVFDRDLVYSDVETIFKTVTGKEFKIQNRLAGYAYGDYSLLEFLSRNVRYPMSAMEAGISGRVYVNVRIDSLGLAKEVSMLRGVHKDLDREAIRVVKLVKDWLPAIRDGKPVESVVTVPVRFNMLK
jgi:TonB family protein